MAVNPNRAFIIDDEPEIREFIGDVAEENGFEVATAESFDRFRAGYGSLEPTMTIPGFIFPERRLGTARSRAGDAEPKTD